MNKKLLAVCSIIAVLSIIAFTASAQYYSTGQNPASVKWKQINTPGFKVVFPEGYETTANYVANTLEYARQLDSVSLSVNPKKIPVLIHNFTSTSNGMVVWAPRRMELYTIPPQDTYAQEWFQQLALHEYRHVIQISKLNQGLTKLLTYLFGEQVTGAVLGLYIPFWFLEGDAVATETALSKAGRGRQPSFAMPLRAQFLVKGLFSYDKAVFGSYKDFVPNHYILGYHIVAKSREKYGFELWNHTFDKVGRNPYMIVPFSEGIKDVTGLTKTKLYNSTLTDIEVQWQAQQEKTPKFRVSEIALPEKRIFTNYSSPNLTSQGTLLAEKKELDNIARFVEVDQQGNEKILFTPGYYYSGTLSQAGNLIAWAERDFDIRWQHRNYSVIRVLDLQTGKATQLTHKTRYFAPNLSPDVTKLAAVDVSEDQQHSLVVLSVATGEVLKRMTTPENYFFTWPKWSDDGKKIVTIVVGNEGKAIALADPESGEIEIVSDFAFTDISKAVIKGNSVVFAGAWSGIDNLYQLDLDTKTISMISSVEFGLTDPVFTKNGDSILFANYTPEGFSIAKIPVNAGNQIPLANVDDNFVKLYQALADQEGQILEPEKISQEQHEIRKYPKMLNLFNIHSWAPISLDAQNYDVKPGISLFSQNLLSSSFTTLGWEYDVNEQTGKYYLNYSYAGWFPVLDFTADYGKRKSYFVDTANNQIDYSWMETNFKAGVHLPLNFSSGKYSRFLRPAVEFNYTQLDMDPESGLRFRRSNYKTINYRLNGSNYLKMSSHDILPKWGQMVALNYRTAPFEGDTLGSMIAAEARLYFPGLFRHHSLNVYGGYQKRVDNNFYYGNIVRFPRGYSGQYAEELTSWSANYALPVGYHDFSLSSLVYLKRTRLNLFYDFATGSARSNETQYSTAGLEVFADTHLFRFIAPITLGYRMMWLTAENTFRSEFLFSINFDSF